MGDALRRGVAADAPAPEGTKIVKGDIIPWEEGLEIYGTLRDLKPITTQYGESELCVFEDENGKRYTFGCPANLSALLHQIGIMGAPITVRCLGKRTNKKGFETWQFRVFREGVDMDGDLPF